MIKFFAPDASLTFLKYGLVSMNFHLKKTPEFAFCVLMANTYVYSIDWSLTMCRPVDTQC